MPNVCHAEASMYTCSDTNQQHIKDMIEKHRLNRLVVASCSPRTHEILFQETLRESGLNQYLFAMTNIRDQCSWVHKDDPVAATAKAVDLMAMAVARARHLKALQTGQLPVTASALILGGGLAGMTAALGIADQGFECTWWRRSRPWAACCATCTRTLEGADVEAYLRQLVDKVQAHPKIEVYLNATPASITGHVGNFKSVLNVAGQRTAHQPRRGDCRDGRPGAAHRAVPARQEPARDHAEQAGGGAGRRRASARAGRARRIPPWS